MIYEGWILGINNSGVDDEVSIVGIMDADDFLQETFCFTKTIAKQLQPYINKWIRYKLDESGACIGWFEPMEKECDELVFL